MTEITYTFNEEEISKLSIGEKIRKGYYEVVNEEEWQKDMQAKYDNISERCERLQKQLDIALDYLATYKQHGTGWVKVWALECEQNIEEVDK